MKEGLNDAGHFASLAINRDRLTAASSRGPIASRAIPVGAAMPEQLSQHLQGSRALATTASTFEAELGDLAGNVPVQFLLLRSRVQFTQLAEEALANGTLLDALGDIKSLRSKVIARLSGMLSREQRDAFNALQTLLQEQQHTVSELASAETHGGQRQLWDGEMRFYEMGACHFECRCAGRTATVHAEQLDATLKGILVTTHITKEVRRAYFAAMHGGPGVLLVQGVAGTGKTETVKDIADMLGLTANVVNASSGMSDEEAFWRPIVEKAGVVIIDEANRASTSAIEAAVRVAKAANVPLCLTFNPAVDEQHSDVPNLMKGRSVAVETLVPQMPKILSSMFGAEGLQEADDLGDRLSSLFASMRCKMSRQKHYDFGLRKLKHVVQQAGAVNREGGWLDERRVVTTAVQQSLLPGVSPLDERHLMRGLVEHFGAGSFMPIQFPSDFWNNAAEKIATTLGRRHCGICLPVLPSEENFVMAVAEDEARKAGAELVVMPRTMADLSGDLLYGATDAAGEWRDGEFTRAIRRTVAEGPPRWMVVFCGDLQPGSGVAQWESLNTLMDDNKTLVLPTGESIRLRPEDRILFAAPNLEHASLATISRLGVINLEAQHRNRM